MTKRLLALLVLPLIVLTINAAPVAADTITIDLNVEFSGAAPPAAPLPWLTLTFTDVGVPAGTVQLKAQASLTGQEFIDTVYFNIAPALYPALLQDGINPQLLINYASGQQAAAVEQQVKDKTGSQGALHLSGKSVGNIFKADGDGYYDIHIEYGQNTFTGNETSVYNLTCPGCTGFGVSSFNFLSSEPDGTQKLNTQYFSAAAHIQGITDPSDGTPSDSGWIGATPPPPPPPSVPEPTTLLLLGCGLATAGCYRLRARKRV